jgi:hypothetical protein
MEEMVALFLPFFMFFPYLCKTNIKDLKLMKRMTLLLAFFGMLTIVMADWTYGTAYFKGAQPSNCLSHGTVMIWYNGSLTQTGLEGGVEIWEGTGDICVVYPKNYKGPKMTFTSTGGAVQIQTLK